MYVTLTAAAVALAAAAVALATAAVALATATVALATVALALAAAAVTLAAASQPTVGGYVGGRACRPAVCAWRSPPNPIQRRQPL